ncbi:MAG: DUF134 domain-containing protein [Candidatus Margulisiibacteriota bacterium]|nr:DUF134 domain-containing protein [Candidatus Margulisiibacteriota bacterium]
MSPRRRKWRFCHPFEGGRFFKPQGFPMQALRIIDLGRDELEAMRLCDSEDLDQEEAAKKMNISRGTVQRLLYAGRKKLLDMVLNAKALQVIGGEHIMHPPRFFQGRGRRWRQRGNI